MKKRLFVAIKTKPKLDQEIKAWQIKHSKLACRWIKEQNLHVTLIPPWHEADEAIVKASLNQIQGKTPKFKISFKKIESTTNEKVIWLTGDASKEILDLKNTLHEILEIPKQNRPFKMHVTVGKINSKEVLEKKLDKKFIFEEKVSEIVLMQSQINNEGADYEILHRINL